MSFTRKNIFRNLGKKFVKIIILIKNLNKDALIKDYSTTRKKIYYRKTVKK